MKPSLLSDGNSIMRIFLLVLIMTLASRVNADCGNLCSETWWISVTNSELISELESGADVNARNRADQGKTPLHYAAQYSKNHEYLQTLLNYGAKLKARAKNNLTALHTAAAFGTPDKIKVLLDAGDDINIRSKDGRNVLHYASSQNKPDNIVFLIESGVEAKAKTKTGQSALHIAASNSMIENIKVLVQLGADLNASDKEGLSPLHNAAVSGTLDAVKVLVESGANILTESKNGYTPWDLGQKNLALVDPEFYQLLQFSGAKCGRLCSGWWWEQAKSTDVLRELNAGANVNAYSDDGYFPLVLLIYYYPYVGLPVEKMLQFEADVNAKVKAEDMYFGHTALHYASKYGQLENIQVLIAAGASIDSVSGNGDTALHLAASSGEFLQHKNTMIENGAISNLIPDADSNIQTVKLLLEAGAKTEIKNRSGMTPLHHSIKSGNENEIVQALLDRGADPNTVNIFGSSPMHDVSSKSILEMLSAAGAKTELKDVDGRRPRDNFISGTFRPYQPESVGLPIISLEDFGGILKLLNGEPCTIFCDVGWWQKASKEELQSEIEEQKKRQNLNTMLLTPNKDGQIPLFFAIKSSNLKLLSEIRPLLNQSIFNYKDFNGWNAIHFAAASGDIATLEFVLNLPVTITDKTAEGQSVRDLALLNPKLKNSKILERLSFKCTNLCSPEWWKTASELDLTAEIEDGVKVKHMDGEGRSPLHYAAKLGTFEHVALLLEAGAKVKVKGKNGNSPLHYVSSGNVGLLLDAGADVNARNKDGETPLHTNDLAHLLPLIMAPGVKINAKDKSGFTPLHIVASQSRGEAGPLYMENMLFYGADINIKSKDGLTPLYVAANRLIKENVAFLLEAGADPDISTNNGFTPLHAVAYQPNAETIMKLLTDVSDNMDAQEEESEQTALYLAVVHKQAGNVKVLLDAGADANIPRKDGFIPIFTAVMGVQSLEILKSLINADADIEFMGPHGYFALDYFKAPWNEHKLSEIDIAMAIDLLTPK